MRKTECVRERTSYSCQPLMAPGGHSFDKEPQRKGEEDNHWNAGNRIASHEGTKELDVFSRQTLKLDHDGQRIGIANDDQRQDKFIPFQMKCITPTVPRIGRREGSTTVNIC
jgi:hypothetical protein